MGHHSGSTVELAIGAILCKNLKSIRELINVKLTSPESGHLIEGATVSYEACENKTIKVGGFLINSMIFHFRWNLNYQYPP